MIYLYSMVAAVAILGFLPSKYGLRQNHCKNYLIICGVLITLVYGLRSIYVGTGDTYAYAYRFLQLRKYDNFGDFFNEKLADVDFMASETGYYLSLWLLGRVVEDPQWLVFTSTAFITWSTCRFFYKNAEDPHISLMMYVCLGMCSFNTNGMRQALAMSICLLAYTYAKERKLLKFILMVLLAMQFHKTAMCFFPVFVLPSLKNTKGNWLIYIGGLICCLLFMDKIVFAYNDFSEKDYVLNNAAEGGGVVVVLLYLAGIVLSFFNPQLVKKSSYRVALFGTLTGLVAYIARYIGSDIMERVSYYYNYFLMLMLPEGMKGLDKKERELVTFLFVLCALILFVYRNRNSNFRLFF